MKTRALKIFLPSALALVLMAGSARQALGAEALPNPKCPVLTDEDSDPNLWTEYQGKKVYFCCEKCRTQFIEQPAQFLKNLPQFQSVAAKPPLAAGAGASSGHAPETPATAAAADPPPRPRRTGWIVFLGNFHPPVVHFPVALILCAAFAELLFLLTARPFFSQGARLMLVFGAAGSVVAAALGLAAAFQTHRTGEMLVILERHRWLGLATALLVVVATLFSELFQRGIFTRRSLWAYRALLFVSAVLVAATGYLGGTLVFGVEHFTFR